MEKMSQIAASRIEKDFKWTTDSKILKEGFKMSFIFNFIVFLGCIFGCVALCDSGYVWTGVTVGLAGYAFVGAVTGRSIRRYLDNK